jgi:hypothetical protein
MQCTNTTGHNQADATRHDRLKLSGMALELHAAYASHELGERTVRGGSERWDEERVTSGTRGT